MSTTSGSGKQVLDSFGEHIVRQCAMRGLEAVRDLEAKRKTSYLRKKSGGRVMPCLRKDYELLSTSKKSRNGSSGGEGGTTGKSRNNGGGTSAAAAAAEDYNSNEPSAKTGYSLSGWQPPAEHSNTEYRPEALADVFSPRYVSDDPDLLARERKWDISTHDDSADPRGNYNKPGGRGKQGAWAGSAKFMLPEKGPPISKRTYDLDSFDKNNIQNSKKRSRSLGNRNKAFF